MPNTDLPPPDLADLIAAMLMVEFDVGSAPGHPAPFSPAKCNDVAKVIRSVIAKHHNKVPLFKNAQVDDGASC